MANVEYKSPCVLCGQPVEIDAFTLKGSQGELKFCCAGCLSIYRLLNDKESTSSINNTLQKKEETKK